jgi:hypothetical protein
MVAPMVNKVAVTWPKVFNQQLFTSMEVEFLSQIERKLQEVMDSLPETSRDACREVFSQKLQESSTTVKRCLRIAEDSMQTMQKQVSTEITPDVEEYMKAGYLSAQDLKGAGSFSRQKV